ncbi:MAG: CAP domain-containing protein [Bacteroidota bacterium]
MKMRLQFAISVLFVLVASSCSKETIGNADIPIPENKNAVQVEQELLGIVNAHRTALGYNTLAFSEVAYAYANEHTDYMIAKGNLSHDNFSARASGISSEADAEYVAENVAKNYATAVEAFENWLDSPNHRKTIEDNFTHTGISVKTDAAGNYYFTQLFYR